MLDGERKTDQQLAFRCASDSGSERSMESAIR